MTAIKKNQMAPRKSHSSAAMVILIRASMKKKGVRPKIMSKESLEFRVW